MKSTVIQFVIFHYFELVFSLEDSTDADVLLELMDDGQHSDVRFTRTC